MKKIKYDFEKLLKAMDEAARKVHKSNAKHQIVKRVYDPKTGKYIKVKRFKVKNHMNKREERKFFGHNFDFKGLKSKFIELEGYTLLFDKLKRLYDVSPKDEDSIIFLSNNRGRQYEMFL